MKMTQEIQMEIEFLINETIVQMLNEIKKIFDVLFLNKLVKLILTVKIDFSVMIDIVE